MTATKHERSVHIDAPVATVFAYVEDPEHFMAAFLTEEERRHTAAVDISMTPEGVGSTVRLAGRMLHLFHIEWTVTREEYVPNERIVDHVPAGKLIYSFAPDADGTTLTLAFEWTFNLPVVGDAIDRVSWNGDRDLEHALTELKRAIEA